VPDVSTVLPTEGGGVILLYSLMATDRTKLRWWWVLCGVLQWNLWRGRRLIAGVFPPTPPHPLVYEPLLPLCLSDEGRATKLYVTSHFLCTGRSGAVMLSQKKKVSGLKWFRKLAFVFSVIFFLCVLFMRNTPLNVQMNTLKGCSVFMHTSW